LHYFPRLGQPLKSKSKLLYCFSPPLALRRSLGVQGAKLPGIAKGWDEKSQETKVRGKEISRDLIIFVFLISDGHVGKILASPLTRCASFAE
jgi:hypothetical protein